jgi:type IV secretory pathway VirB4 component
MYDKNQKIKRIKKKFSKSCHKKLSNSGQKIIKKLLKSCQKIVKKLEKILKRVGEEEEEEGGEEGDLLAFIAFALGSSCVL